MALRALVFEASSTIDRRQILDDRRLKLVECQTLLTIEKHHIGTIMTH